jgi:hypothetical protein
MRRRLGMLTSPRHGPLTLDDRIRGEAKDGNGELSGVGSAGRRGDFTQGGGMSHGNSIRRDGGDVELGVGEGREVGGCRRTLRFVPVRHITITIVLRVGRSAGDEQASERRLRIDVLSASFGFVAVGFCARPALR